MAIYGVYGLPGAGKTTFLTYIAQRSLAGKGFMDIPAYNIVFTNFECSGCYKLDFDKLGVYDFHDCLILIDEIMLLADCRDYRTFDDNKKYLFSNHRKHNTSIVYCSQGWDDVDRKIRILTTEYFLIENLWKFTVIKPIDRIMDAQGKMVDRYQKSSPLKWKWIYRPKYYQHFDSYNGRKLKPFVPEPWFPDDPDENLQAVDCTGGGA